MIGFEGDLIDVTNLNAEITYQRVHEDSLVGQAGRQSIPIFEVDDGGLVTDREVDGLDIGQRY